MTDNARRVALLARPGVAADRLREMIDESGLERVLSADPTQLEAPELIAAEAQVVVIALDPTTEDILERFDAVLGDPMIDVIYEEAELAVAREGWDAARWKRHLVAKLLGHRDVLPPGTESVAQDQAQVVAAQPIQSSFDPVEAESGGYDAYDSYDGGAEAGESIDFDLTFATDLEGSNGQAPAGADSDSLAAASFNADVTPRFEPAEAASDTDIDTDSGLGLGSAGLSLVDVDDDAAQAQSGQAERFQHDMADLERRISTLELVDDSLANSPDKANGAVLVMAGIGGPDAVRQFLGALPEGFPRPVLVQQRLDGGRHDRLVAQMQRATPLPVRLAEAGHPALAGHVYVLPSELGLALAGDGLEFAEGAGLLEVLPSADSAVLMLSGSDATLVDMVVKHGWAGALIAGQAPEGCYDAAAPTDLAARGGQTGQPIELASRLAERWPG
ncbi:chemotaxis protein CheB [Lysobacter sp. A3-1-A15]|uniref:chemotaxis protein CheB n=1 Tax=Novilysobacter viscosus TaxID=3098602 RepID=UPI002ED9B3EF